MGLIRRKNTLQSLQQQAVSDNYQQRVKHLANIDMPLDFLLAGELAQIQTFGIPSISRLLHRTRQYEQAGTKRLDDTRAILTECIGDGVSSERGRFMVERLNFIHGHYCISNDDYLYTLALFMVEPVRWCQTFGYRRLDETERQALYLQFRELGEAMNIRNIPADYNAMEAWYLDYRRRHLAYDAANRAVTEGLIRGMQGMLPKLLQPLTRGAIRALILTLINDDELLAALGIKPVAAPLRWSIVALMKTRSWLFKWLNPWQLRPFEGSLIQRYYASYPRGFTPQCLGPEKIMRRATPDGCPHAAAQAGAAPEPESASKA